jgi:hypothetical protein
MENAVVSSQEMMAPARPVDLSGTSRHVVGDSQNFAGVGERPFHLESSATECRNRPISTTANCHAYVTKSPQRTELS